MKIILASQSPRRRELLTSIGIPIRCCSPHISEVPQRGEGADEMVKRFALEKALTVARPPGRKPAQAIVLGADTAVVVEDKVLGKPRHEADATRMLRLLSGRIHEVKTGFALVSPNKIYVDSVTSQVRFRVISPEEIRWYISTKEPFDKAGAYAVQGKGMFLIDGLEGSFTNVVGLPLDEVLHVLIREFQFSWTYRKR